MMLKIKIYSASGRRYKELEKYKYDYENNTIIISSLEDLIRLPKELKKDVIIKDPEYTFLNQPELFIYDDYIE